MAKKKTPQKPATEPATEMPYRKAGTPNTNGERELASVAWSAAFATGPSDPSAAAAHADRIAEETIRKLRALEPDQIPAELRAIVAR